ncbi:MAG TPA: hypothetical protein DD414_04310 [Lachnospiraceae bacterium]|nr:hypothetical protein [Lachnospiraceae bacterium]
MKRQWKKLLTIAGVLSMMSLTLYGCRDASEPSNVTQDVYGQGVEEPEENPGEDVSQGGTSAPEENASLTPQEEEEADLVGHILETGQMQFTVAEVITEESEDGASVMVTAAPDGDDSDFNHATVAYDEETVFYIRKIYDGGARYEDLDASAEELKTDVLVSVWGDYEEDGQTFHAVKVQMDQFV